MRNVEQTNESNLKKMVLGRVDLVPSYRYVALDTARRLQLPAQIREMSPPLDSVPTFRLGPQGSLVAWRSLSGAEVPLGLFGASGLAGRTSCDMVAIGGITDIVRTSRFGSD